jgi:hypothetical protein
MDYKKHYDLLMETRRERNKISGAIYENHHIMPKSLGGSDDQSNMILLTPREHYIAHWLLWRIYRNKEMAFAFYCMIKMNKRTENITSSRAYEEAKSARREFIIENNKKYHTGKKISEKDKELTSQRFKNIPKSEEHRKKISDSNKGKPKSDQHREKLSLSLMGKHKWSDERKKSHSEKISGENSKTAKKVEQILDGITINTFTSCDSAWEYALSTLDQKVSKVTFWRRVRGHSELFGFHWKFKDE